MLDKIQNFMLDMDNRTGLFIAAVVVMFVLRAIGFSGLAMFLALIYIMYFVSVARK